MDEIVVLSAVKPFWSCSYFTETVLRVNIVFFLIPTSGTKQLFRDVFIILGLL